MALFPDSTTIYLAGDEVGLMIIDVRDPLKPLLVNTTKTKGSSTGVTVSDLGDKLYLSSGYSSTFTGAGLEIYNIKKRIEKIWKI